MSEPTAELFEFTSRNAEQQKRDELILGHLPLVKHVIGRLLGDLPAKRRTRRTSNPPAYSAWSKPRPSSTRPATRSSRRSRTCAFAGRSSTSFAATARSPQHVLQSRDAHPQGLPHAAAPGHSGSTRGRDRTDSKTRSSDTLAAERFAKTTSWEQTAEPKRLRAGGRERKPRKPKPSGWESVQQLSEAIESLPAEANAPH